MNLYNKKNNLASIFLLTMSLICCNSIFSQDKTIELKKDFKVDDKNINSKFTHNKNQQKEMTKVEVNTTITQDFSVIVKAPSQTSSSAPSPSEEDILLKIDYLKEQNCCEEEIEKLNLLLKH